MGHNLLNDRLSSLRYFISSAFAASRAIAYEFAAVLILLLMPEFGGKALAQDIVSAQATATVQSAITVTATQPINFGDVLIGIPKAIGWNNDDSSAIFTITGQAAAGINIVLTLPEYLSLADGSDRLSVIFRSNDAAVDTSNTATPSSMVAGNGWINQNPHNLPSSAVIGTPGSNTKVYLGGKVVPSGNQKAGSYSGDIVLSVSYNGL
jgi:hypothetical protein